MKFTFHLHGAFSLIENNLQRCHFHFKCGLLKVHKDFLINSFTCSEMKAAFLCNRALLSPI